MSKIDVANPTSNRRPLWTPTSGTLATATYVQADSRRPAQGAVVDADLGTLATATYVQADDRGPAEGKGPRGRRSGQLATAMHVKADPIEDL